MLLKLLNSHYSMICSIFAGIISFVALFIVESIVLSNKETAGNKKTWHVATLVVAEIFGVFIFELLSLVLTDLDFTWGSAFMSGTYAIAVYAVVKTLK